MSQWRIAVVLVCAALVSGLLAAGCSSPPEPLPTRPTLDTEDKPEKGVPAPPWYKPPAERSAWPLEAEPKFGTPEWREWCSVRYNPRTVLPLLTTAPDIDGKVSEEFWKGATVPDAFVGPGSVPATPKTTVALAYDKDNLYVALTCEELYPTKLAAHSDKADAFSRADDHVEIDLAPNWRDKTFPIYWILVNSKGITADGRDSDAAWNPGTRGAADVQQQAWTAEVAIPLAGLGVKADDLWGRVWACRIVRHRFAGGSHEASSWTRLLDTEHGLANWGHVLFKGVRPPETPEKKDETKKNEPAPPKNAAGP